jgi:hypothetical protein
MVRNSWFIPPVIDTLDTGTFSIQDTIAPVDQLGPSIYIRCINWPSGYTALLTGIIIICTAIVFISRSECNWCFFERAEAESVIRTHLFPKLIMIK